MRHPKEAAAAVKAITDILEEDNDVIGSVP
jgi:hypothetical protein